jgi:hypothetical protein
MIEIGAVVVKPELTDTFYSTLKPIGICHDLECLKVVGYSHEDTLKFTDAEETMKAFESWILKMMYIHKDNRVYFISDNNGFDWQFINYYFHRFLGYNPFGYSSTNLGSLYKGFVGDTFQNFKHLRITEHTHNPVDDARGNAEALLKIKEMGLKIKL